MENRRGNQWRKHIILQRAVLRMTFRRERLRVFNSNFLANFAMPLTSALVAPKLRPLHKQKRSTYSVLWSRHCAHSMHGVSKAPDRAASKSCPVAYP
eukprot:4180032-Lingulodinium_polyedra.AAC.1